MAGIPGKGGFSGAVADGTSTAVAVPGGAKEFWVLSSGAAWLTVNTSSAPLTALNTTKATPIGAGLYGPFSAMPGYGTYVHVGGNGGTPTITVTFA